MAEYTRPMFKRINKIIGSFAVAQVSQPIKIGGLNATLQVLTGNLWINDKQSAVADATSFKLLATNEIDINADTLNMISDASGATVQIIVWED